MVLSERDKRMVLRGMSLARAILKNVGCDHHGSVLTYQEEMADVWNLEAGDFEQAEFKAILDQINDAIALKHPDWVNRSGKRWQVRQ